MASVINSITALTTKLGLTNGTIPTPTQMYHPLDPLSATEISDAVQAIRKHSNGSLWFKSTQLVEPPKSILSPWLDRNVEGIQQDPLPRIAEVLLGIKSTDSVKWMGMCLD